jgi:hypothetical protein
MDACSLYAQTADPSTPPLFTAACTAPVGRSARVQPSTLCGSGPHCPAPRWTSSSLLAEPYSRQYARTSACSPTRHSPNPTTATAVREQFGMDHCQVVVTCGSEWQ